jgi:histidine triad (HIT) family protein
MNRFLRFTSQVKRNDTIYKILTGVIGWMFTHMSYVIPVNRLRETDTLLAFHHPKPAYPFHVILVPKKEIPALTDLDPNDSAFFRDLYSIVQSLVDEFHLPAYRLIVNGGEYQDFPHLHFHLISPSPLTPAPSPLSRGESKP